MSVQESILIKPERLRFSPEDNLIVLREILSNNPFENGRKWSKIHNNIVFASGRPFTLRSIKERLEYMLKIFIKEDYANRKKSGTEEQYNERDRLLQEAKDLKREFSTAKCKVLSSKNLGLALRESAASICGSDAPSETSSSSCAAWAQIQNAKGVTATSISCAGRYADEINQITGIAESLFPPGDNVLEETGPIERPAEVPTDCTAPRPALTLKPIHSRKSRSNVQLKKSALLYLEERNNAENEFKHQQLQLEERKLHLEERRLALEERKVALEEARLEMEKNERLENLKMQRELQQGFLAQQTAVMSLLQQAIEKKY